MVNTNEMWWTPALIRYEYHNDITLAWTEYVKNIKLHSLSNELYKYLRLMFCLNDVLIVAIN